MVRGMNYTPTFSTTIFENGTKESEKRLAIIIVYINDVRLHIMGRSIILNNTRITFSIMVSCSSKCLLLYNIHYSSNNHAQFDDSELNISQESPLMVLQRTTSNIFKKKKPDRDA